MPDWSKKNQRLGPACDNCIDLDSIPQRLAAHLQVLVQLVLKRIDYSKVS
jgi:hypothetical protein